ncbi:MAG: amidohydrolase family protein [Pseudomonadota bacterium]
MGARRIIRNACVISVDPEIGTQRDADILIDDDHIAAIETELDVEDAEPIDASGMIAMPGLVCCHRHLWMTLLRGFISDGTWSSYLVETFWGRRPLYRPEDSHIAAYAGALDAIDAGVTTVLDFHDCSVRESLADASLDALEKSGLRAVFAYGLEGPPDLEGTAGAESLSPTLPWHRDEALRLRNGRLSSDDGLITMGMTARNLEFLPFACAEHDLGLARELGVRTVTTHAGSGALGKGATLVDNLRDHDLLGPDILFSHGQSFTDEELDTLAATGVKIVVSVESELGQGADPVTWRALQHGVSVSLGADSVGSLAGDMFRHMQMTLKVGRGSRARLLDEQGIAPTDVALTSRDMLEIATMGGARSLRLDDRIGSLTPGKQADIILLSRERVGMMSGAEPEQIAVLQANGRDVDTVLIAGRVLKRHGVLLDADLKAVARSLEASRAYLDESYGHLDTGGLWDTYNTKVAAAS